MNNIQIGDRVSHNIFPPVEGKVFGGYPELAGDKSLRLKVYVRRDDGTVYADYLNTWSLVEDGNVNTADKVDSGDNNTDSDVIDVECTVVK